MSFSQVGDKSFVFAVRVVNMYRYLCDEKREFILSRQVLRSGTSVGANIREALYAQSKKDYLNKMNIALKEASETIYWIELLHATDYLSESFMDSIWKDCDELVRMLSSIVKTTKNNLKTERHLNS